MKPASACHVQTMVVCCPQGVAAGSDLRFCSESMLEPPGFSMAPGSCVVNNCTRIIVSKAGFSSVLSSEGTAPHRCDPARC
jgi:hypothetical protein